MAKWQRIRIKIPEDYSATERQAIGEEIVKTIRERSKDGIGLKSVRSTGVGSEKPFAGYSSSYVRSLDFKNAGKSRGDVNLTLSGDMLAAIKVLSHSKGSVLVGFENGTEENDRAEGNQLGTYGQSTPIKGKARKFLGITSEEKKEILDQFPVRDREQSLARAISILDVIRGARRAARGEES